MSALVQELDVTMIQSEDGRFTNVMAAIDVIKHGEEKIYAATGSSICDPIDTPDGNLGYRLALGRALVDLGHKIKSEAWRDVPHTTSRHQFRFTVVGDEILVEGFPC